MTIVPNSAITREDEKDINDMIEEEDEDILSFEVVWANPAVTWDTIANVNGITGPIGTNAMYDILVTDATTTLPLSSFDDPSRNDFVLLAINPMNE